MRHTLDRGRDHKPHKSSEDVRLAFFTLFASGLGVGDRGLGDGGWTGVGRQHQRDSPSSDGVMRIASRLRITLLLSLV